MTPDVWLLVILTCLATHRATRLITRDHLPLIAIPRQRFIMWADPPAEVQLPDGTTVPIEPRPRYPLGILGRSLAFLLECDWCMSVWVATVMVLMEWYLTNWPVPYPPLLVAAASTVTGLIAQREPD